MEGTLKRWSRQLLTLPPRVLFHKAVDRLGGELTRVLGRWRDARRCTHAECPPGVSLEPRLPPLDPALALALAPHLPALRALCREVMDNRFDLLGSGWVTVQHGLACAGVEGHRFPPAPSLQADPQGNWLRHQVTPPNLAESQRIWRLIEGPCQPIDWQLDFKSGWRWDPRQWYRDITFAQRPGVDVKVPWELGRMQHLPWLAWGYAASRRGAAGLPPAAGLLRAFRNQVLDFIASNPPRYGVQWACTMDVGIRVANWLLAYDLFLAAGARFDPPFVAVLTRAVWGHAQHIAGNPEWYRGRRSNHFLANVCGLLFAAAHLPGNATSDGWLARSIHQLATEAAHQFFPEGSNFEDSTCYHRLSAEMVLYSAALVAGLPAQRLAPLACPPRFPLDPWPPCPPGPLPRHPQPGGRPAGPLPPLVWERLAAMVRFTAMITRPDGRVPQIGDNDSGRFFKVVPSAYRCLPVRQAAARFAHCAAISEPYWWEDSRDHRHLSAAFAGLCHGAADRPPDALEALVVAGLAGGPLPMPPPPPPRPRVAGDPPPLPPPAADAFRAHTRPGLLQGLERLAYPAFGLWLYRSPRLYLAIRCGRFGHDGKGAHAHHDQLAVELMIDGQVWFEDPGSYLYTPLPALRNQYRSVAAHAAPRLADEEPGELQRALFQLADRCRCRCLAFDEQRFIGRHDGFSAPLLRQVTLLDDGISIADYRLDHDGVHPLPGPGARHTPPTHAVPPVSGGYGQRPG